MFSKWDLNTFWTQPASFKRSHTKLQTSFYTRKYLIIKLLLINEVSYGFVQNHAVHLLIIRESLVQAQVGPPLKISNHLKIKWLEILFYKFCPQFVHQTDFWPRSGQKISLKILKIIDAASKMGIIWLVTNNRCVVSVLNVDAYFGSFTHPCPLYD